jgi:hypothetical protein
MRWVGWEAVVTEGASSRRIGLAAPRAKQLAPTSTLSSSHVTSRRFEYPFLETDRTWLLWYERNLFWNRASQHVDCDVQMSKIALIKSWLMADTASSGVDFYCK